LEKKIEKIKKSYQGQRKNEELLTLVDLILIVARQLKLVLVFPIIFGLIAIVYVTFVVKPIYKSTSKIISSSTGGNMSQAVGIAAQFGFNLPSNNSGPKWVYPEIIRSRTLAKSVLKQKFILDQGQSKRTLLEILTGNIKNSNNVDEIEQIGVDQLLKMINVYENIKTSILTVSVNASEAKLAYEINNTLIKELDKHQKEYNKSKTSKTKQFIKERIIDTEKELVLAEENLKVFMDRNRRIENSPALQLEKQRLSRETAVLTGVFTTLKQQLETTKIEEVKDSDYVIVLDQPEVPLFRSKPNKKLIVSLFIIFGLVIGLIFSFVKELISKSTQSEKNKFKMAKKIFLYNLKDFKPKIFR